MLPEDLEAYLAWPLPNVWVGVSCENQHFADERIPLLEATPAAVRFLSIEPQLGPVDLSKWFGRSVTAAGRETRGPLTQQGAVTTGEGASQAVGNVAKPQLDPSGAVASSDRPSISWVIVGGESGARARPFDLAWARSIVEQCQAAGVPVFVKQLGAHPIETIKQGPYHPGGASRLMMRDKKGGDPAQWPFDFPRQFPEARRAV